MSRARDVGSRHLADITMAFGDVRFLGVKRTFGNSAAMSANDPTFGSTTATFALDLRPLHPRKQASLKSQALHLTWPMSS